MSIDRKSIWWPVFLSGLVLPGLGQMANREYKKGVLLITSSLVSFFWFSKLITERVSLLLPGTPDLWMNDPDKLREAITKLVNDDTHTFFTFHLLMLALWLFSIVDAYISAKKLVKLS